MNFKKSSLKNKSRKKFGIDRLQTWNCSFRENIMYIYNNNIKKTDDKHDDSRNNNQNCEEDGYCYNVLITILISIEWHNNLHLKQFRTELMNSA